MGRRESGKKEERRDREGEVEREGGREHLTTLNQTLPLRHLTGSHFPRAPSA